MNVAARLSMDDFRVRAAREDGGSEAAHPGDHALNPELTETILRRPLRDAAVLIAAVERNGGPSLILTRRTENMRSHSGQVAFPGGRVAAAFEVPLGFLMDPRNHKTESRVWRGGERRYWTMPYGERRIWGVTAGIIRTLYERLYA